MALVVQDFAQAQTFEHMRYVLVVQNMAQAQVLEYPMLTYWLTSIDWVKSPHVHPSAGTRRLLHPLHGSRFIH
jgi:hypothetical protein